MVIRQKSEKNGKTVSSVSLQKGLITYTKSDDLDQSAHLCLISIIVVCPEIDEIQKYKESTCEKKRS